MKQENWQNFLRIAIIVNDHLTNALVSLIELNLQDKKLTFELFLNQNQHAIYHMCYNHSTCCRCLQQASREQSCRVLFPSQLEILFDKSNKFLGHRPKHCPNFCCSCAKSGISTDVLNMILARCILVNFCVDIFWSSCLLPRELSMAAFLNQNKHILYHLWQYDTTCCQCHNNLQSPVNCQILNQEQWTCMFITSSSNTFCSQSSFSTNCICSTFAKPGICQDHLDSVLQQKILAYCSPTLKSVETLMEISRNIYRHIEAAQLTDSNYNRYKNDIESAVMDIAVICGKEKEFKMALNDVWHRTLDFSLLIKYKNSLNERKSVSIIGIMHPI